MSIRISRPLRSLAGVESRKASTKFFKQMEFWIRANFFEEMRFGRSKPSRSYCHLKPRVACQNGAR